VQGYEPKRRPTPGVTPELALAHLPLRQVCLLAVFDMLPGLQHASAARDHAVALAAGRETFDRYGLRPEGGLEGPARRFFRYYYVGANIGLADPFFGGDREPIWDAALIAAMESIRTSRSAPVEFHARLWRHILQEDRRWAAVRAYAMDQALLSFPPSASRAAIERYRRRLGALFTAAESVPALLAVWAIERNPRRLDDLARPELKAKHGLFEQRHMARFLGMTPNALTQSLKRLRRRLGEEMRVLWDIEKTDPTSEDPEP
jgi:hypothetical protein